MYNISKQPIALALMSKQPLTKKQPKQPLALALRTEKYTPDLC